MRILFVCATPGEAVFSDAGQGITIGEAYRMQHSTHAIDVLVTGVGMVATAYHLGRTLLQNHYDFAINIGICGAFDHTLIGKTVNVKQ